MWQAGWAESVLLVVGPEPAPAQFRVVIFWPLEQCQAPGGCLFYFYLFIYLFLAPSFKCQLLTDSEASTAPQSGMGREEEMEVAGPFSARTQLWGWAGWGNCFSLESFLVWLGRPLNSM